jgi:hypothetical protein
MTAISSSRGIPEPDFSIYPPRQRIFIPQNAIVSENAKQERLLPNGHSRQYRWQF